MGLLKQFEGMQLPAASELEWLVPEHDAPQKVGLSRPPCPGTREPSDLVLLSHMSWSGVNLYIFSYSGTYVVYKYVECPSERMGECLPA